MKKLPTVNILHKKSAEERVSYAGSINGTNGKKEDPYAFPDLDPVPAKKHRSVMSGSGLMKLNSLQTQLKSNGLSSASNSAPVLSNEPGQIAKLFPELAEKLERNTKMHNPPSVQLNAKISKNKLKERQKRSLPSYPTTHQSSGNHTSGNSYFNQSLTSGISSSSGSIYSISSIVKTLSEKEGASPPPNVICPKSSPMPQTVKLNNSTCNSVPVLHIPALNCRAVPSSLSSNGSCLRATTLQLDMLSPPNTVCPQASLLPSTSSTVTSYPSANMMVCPSSAVVGATASVNCMPARGYSNEVAVSNSDHFLKLSQSQSSFPSNNSSLSSVSNTVLPFTFIPSNYITTKSSVGGVPPSASSISSTLSPTSLFVTNTISSVSNCGSSNLSLNEMQTSCNFSATNRMPESMKCRVALNAIQTIPSTTASTKTSDCVNLLRSKILASKLKLKISGDRDTMIMTPQLIAGSVGDACQPSEKQAQNQSISTSVPIILSESSLTCATRLPRISQSGPTFSQVSSTAATFSQSLPVGSQHKVNNSSSVFDYQPVANTSSKFSSNYAVHCQISPTVYTHEPPPPAYSSHSLPFCQRSGTVASTTGSNSFSTSPRHAVALETPSGHSVTPIASSFACASPTTCQVTPDLLNMIGQPPCAKFSSQTTARAVTPIKEKIQDMESSHSSMPGKRLPVLKPVTPAVSSGEKPIYLPVKRTKNVMTESVAKKVLKRHSALKVYAYYASQKIYNSDLLHTGVDSSDDSDFDDTLPTQNQWFSPSDIEDEDIVCQENVQSEIRSTKLALLRSRVRRQFTQLRKAQVVNHSYRCYEQKAMKVLIAAAKKSVDAAAEALRCKFRLQKPRVIEDDHFLSFRPCLYVTGETNDSLCGAKTMPYTNHCSKHIMMNVEQQMYGYCTSKFSDNTQCCVPVFDIWHKLPLCPEHSVTDNCDANTDNRLKKPRKKSKPSALTRPSRKGKGRKKTVRRNGKNEETDVEEMSPTSSTSDNASAFPAIHSVQTSSDLPELSASLIASMDAKIDLDQATEFLNEHDLNDVLNKLPEDAFDLLTGTDVKDLVNDCKVDEFDLALAEVARYGADLDAGDELTKQIADQILNQTSTDHLGDDGLVTGPTNLNSICELTNSISDSELKSMSQALSSNHSEAMMQAIAQGHDPSQLLKPTVPQLSFEIEHIEGKLSLPKQECAGLVNDLGLQSSSHWSTTLMNGYT